MANEFSRNIGDAAFTRTQAFPAAGANNVHASMDLGVNANVPERMELEISWPLLTALVDTKTVTFAVEDSADNTTFAAIGMTGVITGAGGIGVAAGAKRFRLPSNCRRYVQVRQTSLDAATGNLTASSSTVRLVF